MRKPNSFHQASAAKQRGASLFIALIILLVITLLALSSTREVTLESRITGNFTEQQKLFNSAEMGLRDGEISITAPLKPLEPTSECEAGGENTQPPPCLLALTNGLNSYDLLFSSANKSRPYFPDSETKTNPNTTISWYAVPAPTGESEGQSLSPEYGSLQGAVGTISLYEINSRAVNTVSGNVTYLRSTTAKLFDQGQ
jgi:type IV pilus assembly protein PilX